MAVEQVPMYPVQWQANVRSDDERDLDLTIWIMRSVQFFFPHVTKEMNDKR
jgi:hypothetical protein